MIIEFYTPDGGVQEPTIKFVRDEILKLHKQYKNISRADVSFRNRITQKNSEKTCEISLFMAGNTITAKAICKSFDNASKKAVAGINENVNLNLKEKVHSF